MVGIYKITNLINNKVYIGQSWDIEARWAGHKSKESNSHLRAAFLKYGLDNFELEILREFKESPLTQIFLDIFEVRFALQFEAHDPRKGYNKKECGSGKRQAEETKEKIKKSSQGKHFASEETRQKMSISGKRPKPWNSRPHDEITKRKIREALKNNTNAKGSARPEELRQRISQALKGQEAINKGVPCSEQQKEQIRQSLKGRKASKETREKMSLAHKKRWEERKVLHE